jgi:hypothetical protein
MADVLADARRRIRQMDWDEFWQTAVLYLEIKPETAQRIWDEAHAAEAREKL